MSYKDMNAPDLVKQWKKLVNDNVMMGRDAKLMREALDLGVSSVQIMLGMYFYRGNRTISIPQFLRRREIWVLEEELDAEIELACRVANTLPPAYFPYFELRDELNPEYTRQFEEAKKTLLEWKEKVLA